MGGQGTTRIHGHHTSCRASGREDSILAEVSQGDEAFTDMAEVQLPSVGSKPSAKAAEGEGINRRTCPLANRRLDG